MTIPLRAQLEEVNREIAVRTRVYPRWIQEQKITRDRAATKLETMKAVADTLRELVQQHESLPL